MTLTPLTPIEVAVTDEDCELGLYLRLNAETLLALSLPRSVSEQDRQLGHDTIWVGDAEMGLGDYGALRGLDLSKESVTFSFAPISHVACLLGARIKIDLHGAPAAMVALRQLAATQVSAS